MHLNNKLLQVFLLFAISNSTIAQRESGISIKADMGMCLNFATTKADELSGPSNKKYFYNKNLVGVSSGLELSYGFSAKSALSIGYQRFSNSKSISYIGEVNSTQVSIENFELRDIDHFFNAGYIRKMNVKNSIVYIEGGISLLNAVSQNIALENWDNSIDIYQTVVKHPLNEFSVGFFLGVGYSMRIEKKFEIGIRSRLYYMADLNWIEGMSLCPTLSYRF